MDEGYEWNSIARGTEEANAEYQGTECRDEQGQLRTCVVKCGKRKATYEREVALYNARWPRHCRKCDGTGLHTWRENQAPLGSGLRWMEEMTEGCPECVGKGKCPQCAGELREIDFGDNWLCDACGWEYGAALADELEDPKPAAPECECNW